MSKSYYGDSVGMIDRQHPERNRILWYEDENPVYVQVQRGDDDCGVPASDIFTTRDKTCMGIFSFGMTSCLVSLFSFAACPPLGIITAVFGIAVATIGGIAFLVSRDNH